MIRNVSLRKAVENFQKKQQGLDSRLNLAAQSPSKIEKVSKAFWLFNNTNFSPLFLKKLRPPPKLKQKSIQSP